MLSVTPQEVCENPDQAAHYRTLGPNLRALSLTWHMADVRVRIVSYFTLGKLPQAESHVRKGRVIDTEQRR
jgi:hypothetical protein